MRKRTDIVEMFSMFLDANDYQSFSSLNWGKPNARLVSSMKAKSEADPDATEKYWAMFWLKAALKDSQNALARWHISAYLEEVCYSAIFDIFNQITNTSFSQVDCFLIAREEAALTEKVFRNYDFSRSSVKTYAQYRIKGAVLEKIREGREISKYSCTGLLRNITKKLLRTSLQKARIKEPDLTNIILAWQYFKEIYVPTQEEGSRQLKPPSQTELQIIADRYNQRQQNLNNVNIEKIADWLKICCESVQDSQRVTVVYLDDRIAESDLISNDPVDEIAVTEESFQIRNALASEFEALEPKIKALIQLSYGLNFVHNEIGKLAILNVSQSQVSRYNKKNLSSLIERVLDSIQNYRGMKINYDEHLAALFKEVESYLQLMCEEQIQELLSNALIQKYDCETINLLKLRFGQALEIDSIAKKIQIPRADLNNKITEVELYLVNQLKEWIKLDLQVDLTPIESAERKLSKYVGGWLKNAPYAKIEMEWRKINNV